MRAKFTERTIFRPESEYVKHSGQWVTVLDRYSPYTYTIQANDGWRGCALASELSECSSPLRLIDLKRRILGNAG